MEATPPGGTGFMGSAGLSPPGTTCSPPVVKSETGLGAFGRVRCVVALPGGDPATVSSPVGDLCTAAPDTMANDVAVDGVMSAVAGEARVVVALLFVGEVRAELSSGELAMRLAVESIPPDRFMSRVFLALDPGMATPLGDSSGRVDPPLLPPWMICCGCIGSCGVSIGDGVGLANGDDEAEDGWGAITPGIVDSSPLFCCCLLLGVPKHVFKLFIVAYFGKE